MFKPALDNFGAALRDDLPNFGDFRRFEPAIEGKRKIIQPDLAFMTDLENVNVHALGQVVTGEADPIAVLNENRGYDWRELVIPSLAKQTK